MRLSKIVVILVFLFLTACQKEDPPFPGLYHSYINMPYGPDSVYQVMDVYVPAHSTYNHIPVIILIHGGGWFAGGKSDFDGDKIYDTLTHLGYAVVNMNYRLVPATIYPGPLDDVDSVIVTLQRNSEKLGIDAQHICLLGRSSGGQIALQYAYTRNKNNLVKAAVDCFGITDLTARQDMAVRLDTQIANFLGAAYISNKYLWHNASPIYHMDGAIPTAIFHGTIDDTVFPTQSEWLKDSLEQRGIPYEFAMWKGFGHGFDPPTWQATMGIAGAWLNKYMF